jgi:hypothetical protein
MMQGTGVLEYPEFYKVAVASSADHDFRMGEGLVAGNVYGLALLTLPIILSQISQWQKT